jgi:ribonuclease Z
MLPRFLLLAIVSAIAAGGWIATCALYRYRDAVVEVGLLETRHFEAPTLVVLGSGGATENPARLGPALAVGAGDDVILIDAGRGVAERLRAARIPLAQPETVLLTSLLPENTVGLDDLLMSGWRAGRETPLRVVGPPGTRALVDAVQTAQAEARRVLLAEVGLPPEGAHLEAIELSEPWQESGDSLAIRAEPLPGGPLPALAYRVEAGGRSLVMGSVAFGQTELAELARGAGTVVHGAVFRDAVEAAAQAGIPEAEQDQREASLELPLRDAARLADRVGSRTLVLVRLRPPPLFDFQFERIAGEHFGGHVIVAADGEEVSL